MFEWKPEYTVQIGSIDNQHQQLFEIGRELHAAMSKGAGKEVLGKTLDRLIKYTAVHFAHEEQAQIAAGYPDFAAHKALHVALIKKVQEFQKKIAEGQAAVTIELLDFVQNWLSNHILKEDHKYIPFLKGKAA